MKKLDTFIIFWAVAFAILFFIIGIFFKVLASTFYAILNSIVSILKINIIDIYLIIVIKVLIQMIIWMS